MRNLGLIGALLVALWPAPAQAQGDFIKDKVKHLIEKSGVYVSASSRTSLDDDVKMGPSIGIGYGMGGHPRTGRKFPFSFSTFGADLQTNAGDAFGRVRARQILSGIGYGWARLDGKMQLGIQLGVGYSFNSVRLDAGAPAAFGTLEPVGVTVSNSWVLRPQAKVEYFVSRKVSVRTQLSYTYTNPDVVIHTATQNIAREWRPDHVQFSVAMGYFPFRK